MSHTLSSKSRGVTSLFLVSWKRRVAPEGSSVPFLGEDQPQLPSSDLSLSSFPHNNSVVSLGVLLGPSPGSLWDAGARGNGSLALVIKLEATSSPHDRKMSFPQFSPKRKLWEVLPLASDIQELYQVTKKLSLLGDSRAAWARREAKGHSSEGSSTSGWSSWSGRWELARATMEAEGAEPRI